MSDTGGNDAGDRDGAAGASGDPRLGAPPDASQQPRLPFPVVGVGASAGGLEAYIELLRAAPPDAGLAWVLIQHLPPDRESLVADILGKKTAMPVLQVEDGMPVRPDHVYVIRPGHTLTVEDGRLHLGAPLAARGHERPVDDFFRSLAEEQQHRAVAVVLSGMGSNGTAGAQAVKAVGGLVIAQEPESAKFPSMPRSLIDAHLADYILRPDEIAEAVVRYARHPYAADPGGAARVGRRTAAALQEILAVIRTRVRHDFTGYRKPTLVRRVQRRMGLAQIGDMAEYAKVLRQNPGEVSALADDLLIHVTGFFRDPEAWQVLGEKVIAPLAADRADGAAIRCWVAACATGDEAYTLAMLLAEAAEAAGKQFDVKVFATDMAERALGQARSGVFPNGIESEITPERLARFFDKEDGVYRVKRPLRELVVFAPQNVLQDPPFSRLDIVTCRNFLIYVEPEVQRRVLALIHFGLREGGALLLGTSETVGAAEDEWEPIDKKHRLYRRVGSTRPGALEAARAAVGPAGGNGDRPPARGLPRVPVAQLAARALLDHHTPAAVVVDRDGQIAYYHGNTAPYLDPPRGEPTRDLFALANDQVRGAVRQAVERAVSLGGPVAVRDGLIDTPQGRRRVLVQVTPLDRRAGQALYLVAFSDQPERPPAPEGEAGRPASDQKLAEELQRVRDELQGTIEELQTSNEELKASHEEVTSINEELQSTNEELETSKEEMQSLNEELTTVNAQLQAKMDELERTTNDLGSLLSSTDLAVLFLDTGFRIRRFTPAVRELFDLIGTDVGRPLHDLRRKFDDPGLLTDAQAVLDRLIPVEKEVGGENGRAYLRRVTVYRTADNRIDGVVVTFIDVTERRADEAAVRASEEKYRTLFESIDEGVSTFEVVFDENDRAVDLIFLENNRAFTKMTGLPADVVNKPVSVVLPNLERFWIETYEQVVKTGAAKRFEHESAAVGRWFEVHASWAGGRRVILVYHDITARKREEERRAFLLALSDALRAEPGADAVANRALRMLAEQLHLDRCYVGVYRPEDDRADLTHQVGNDRVPPLPDRIRLSDFPKALRVASDRTLVIDDVAAADGLSDTDRRNIGGLGLRALVAASLREGEGSLLWAIVAVSATPRGWTPDEVALVEETAERTWAAVERAKAEAALRASDERNAFLVRFADAARGLADPAAVAAAACRLLAERLGTDRTVWARIDWATREYVPECVVVADGPADAPPRWPLDPAQPYTAEHLAGRPVAYEDAAADPRIPDPARAAMAERGMRAGVAVPVVVGGTLRAVLSTSQREPRRWRPDEVAVAEALAVRAWAEVERAAAEAAVRASEEQFRRAIEEAPIPVIMHAEDGEVLQVSRTWTELTGYALPDVPTVDAWLTRAYGPGADAVREHMHELFAGRRRTLDVEFTIRTRGGEDRHWSFSASAPGALRDGRRFVVGMAVDITDRQRAEAALRASEERLRAVAANLPSAAVFVVGRDLRYALAGGEALGQAGLAAADLEGKTVSEALPPGLVAEYEANYRRALAGESAETEHASHGRHFVTHLAPLRETGGAVTAALAVSYDITDRVRAEAEVRASEERFRLLVEGVRDHAIFAQAPDGTVTSWNPAAERVFGYAAGEIVGRSGDVFFTPEDRAAGMPERERETAAADGRATDENWAVRKDGTRFWASGASSAVRDADGRLTGYVKVVRDRTEERQAEDAVRRAEERLRLALTAARMGIWEWDIPAGTHTRDANLNRLLGLPADPSTNTYDEFLGSIHPDDRGRMDAELQRSAAECRPLNVEFRVVWPDGAVRWLRDQGDVVRGPDGRAARMTGACVDITELKEAEAALRDARDRLEEKVRERTAALADALRTVEREAAARHELAGRLVTAQEDERRRIARDLHDRLGQYLAALRLGLTAAGRAAAADLPAHLARLSELTADTGREVHRLALELRPTALDDLGLGATLRQYVEAWAAQAGIPAEFAAAGLDGERFTWQVSTAVYRVVQEALTNVLKHARATRVGVLVERHPDRLSAVVEDDGIGFDPGGGVGTPRAQGGLGLLGMRERVTLVGGTLEIESSPGAGTSVYVRIPLPPPGGTDG